MKLQTAHWTESSPQKFAYRIASDFIEQIREVMKIKGWSQNKFAKKLNLTPGRVSQILNNPGNLTLETMVQWARALKLKVSVVAYDDNDGSNERGPINAEVFRLCWEHLRKPTDMWSLTENTQAATSAKEVFFIYHDIKGRHGSKQSDNVTAGASVRATTEYRLSPSRLAIGSLHAEEASTSKISNLLSELNRQM